MFFIKSTDCTHKDEKEISFEKASDRLIMKIKQRQEKIKEIQKRIEIYKNTGYEILYIIGIGSFLAQSCSVAPSMRESARSYDWVANTNFPGNQK